MFYAQCPRCLRQDLGTWDLRHYRPTLWTRIQIALGANRWRCEACRCNFVSFFGRKAKYAPPAARAQARGASGGGA
jgi:transposase-like protein